MQNIVTWQSILGCKGEVTLIYIRLAAVLSTRVVSVLVDIELEEKIRLKARSQPQLDFMYKV